MNHQEYIRLGLDGEAPLKLILCGSVQSLGTKKTGVVSVVYATLHKDLAEKKITELSEKNPDAYYMVYSVPLDFDLTTLGHYPSIAITQDDLQ